mgnify:CR=1 FL=1
MSLKMPDEEQIPRDIERKRAKKVTAAKKGHALDGRLGLIIDGTGKDYAKLTKQASELNRFLRHIGLHCSQLPSTAIGFCQIVGSETL